MIGLLTDDKRIRLFTAQYKEKEFDRLKDYALNQISLIECGLNLNSISRNSYVNNKDIWVPLETEINKLYETLLELRSNILSSEERRILDEEKRR